MATAGAWRRGSWMTHDAQGGPIGGGGGDGEGHQALEGGSVPEEVVTGPQGSAPASSAALADGGQVGGRLGARCDPVAEGLGPGGEGVLREGRQDQSDRPRVGGGSLQGHNRIVTSAVPGSGQRGRAGRSRLASVGARVRERRRRHGRLGARSHARGTAPTRGSRGAEERTSSGSRAGADRWRPGTARQRLTGNGGRRDHRRRAGRAAVRAQQPDRAHAPGRSGRRG